MSVLYYSRWNRLTLSSRPAWVHGEFQVMLDDPFFQKQTKKRTHEPKAEILIYSIYNKVFSMQIV